MAFDLLDLLDDLPVTEREITRDETSISWRKVKLNLSVSRSNAPSPESVHGDLPDYEDAQEPQQRTGDHHSEDDENEDEDNIEEDDGSEDEETSADDNKVAPDNFYGSTSKDAPCVSRQRSVSPVSPRLPVASTSAAPSALGLDFSSPIDLTQDDQDVLDQLADVNLGDERDVSSRLHEAEAFINSVVLQASKAHAPDSPEPVESVRVVRHEGRYETVYGVYDDEDGYFEVSRPGIPRWSANKSPRPNRSSHRELSLHPQAQSFLDVVPRNHRRYSTTWLKVNNRVKRAVEARTRRHASSPEVIPSSGGKFVKKAIERFGPTWRPQLPRFFDKLLKRKADGSVADVSVPSSSQMLADSGLLRPAHLPLNDAQLTTTSTNSRVVHSPAAANTSIESTGNMDEDNEPPACIVVPSTPPPPPSLSVPLRHPNSLSTIPQPSATVPLPYLASQLDPESASAYPYIPTPPLEPIALPSLPAGLPQTTLPRLTAEASFESSSTSFIPTPATGQLTLPTLPTLVVPTVPDLSKLAQYSSLSPNPSSPHPPNPPLQSTTSVHVQAPVPNRPTTTPLPYLASNAQTNHDIPYIVTPPLPTVNISPMARSMPYPETLNSSATPFQAQQLQLGVGVATTAPLTPQPPSFTTPAPQLVPPRLPSLSIPSINTPSLRHGQFPPSHPITSQPVAPPVMCSPLYPPHATGSYALPQNFVPLTGPVIPPNSTTPNAMAIEQAQPSIPMDCSEDAYAPLVKMSSPVEQTSIPEFVMGDIDSSDTAAGQGVGGSNVGVLRPSSQAGGNGVAGDTYTGVEDHGDKGVSSSGNTASNDEKHTSAGCEGADEDSDDGLGGDPPPFDETDPLWLQLLAYSGSPDGQGGPAGADGEGITGTSEQGEAVQSLGGGFASGLDQDGSDRSWNEPFDFKNVLESACDSSPDSQSEAVWEELCAWAEGQPPEMLESAFGMLLLGQDTPLASAALSEPSATSIGLECSLPIQDTQSSESPLITVETADAALPSACSPHFALDVIDKTVPTFPFSASFTLDELDWDVIEEYARLEESRSPDSPLDAARVMVVAIQTVAEAKFANMLSSSAVESEILLPLPPPVYPDIGNTNASSPSYEYASLERGDDRAAGIYYREPHFPLATTLKADSGVHVL